MANENTSVEEEYGGRYNRFTGWVGKVVAGGLAPITNNVVRAAEHLPGGPIIAAILKITFGLAETLIGLALGAIGGVIHLVGKFADKAGDGLYSFANRGMPENQAKTKAKNLVKAPERTAERTNEAERTREQEVNEHAQEVVDELGDAEIGLNDQVSENVLNAAELADRNQQANVQQAADPQFSIQTMRIEQEKEFMTKAPGEIYTNEDGTPTAADQDHPLTQAAAHADAEILNLHRRIANGDPVSAETRQELAKHLAMKVMDQKMRRDRLENLKKGHPNTPGDLEKKIQKIITDPQKMAKVTEKLENAISNYIETSDQAKLIKLTSDKPNREFENMKKAVVAENRQTLESQAQEMRARRMEEQQRRLIEQQRRDEQQIQNNLNNPVVQHRA